MKFKAYEGGNIIFPDKLFGECLISRLWTFIYGNLKYTFFLNGQIFKIKNERPGFDRLR